MDAWVRCNKCYRLMKNTREHFLLTQCQHIFCGQCFSEGTQQCPECKSVNVMSVTLERPLQPSLASYFQPLREQAEQFCHVAELQHTQAALLIKRSREIQDKYERLKEAYAENLKLKKYLAVCRRALEEEVEILEERSATSSQALERMEISLADKPKTMTFSSSNFYNLSKQETLRQQTGIEGVQNQRYGQASGFLWNRESSSQKSNNRQNTGKAEDGWQLARNAIVGMQRSNVGKKPNNSVFTSREHHTTAMISDESSESPIALFQNYPRIESSLPSGFSNRFRP